jgi:cytochrome c oxidase cbb3-type subunit 3
MKTAPDLMDEKTVVLLTEPDLAEGKTIFTTNCAAFAELDAGQIEPSHDKWILGGGNNFPILVNGS